MSEGEHLRQTPVGRPIQFPQGVKTRPTLGDAPPGSAIDSDRSDATQEPSTAEFTSDGHEASGRASGRLGDTTMGRPIQAPQNSTVSTITLRQLQEEADLGSRTGDTVEELLENPVEIPRWFTRASAIAIFVVLGIVVFPFIFTETVLVLSALNGLPMFVQIPGYAILGSILFFVVYMTAKCLVFYRRLRLNKQISLTKVRTVSSVTNVGDQAYAATKQMLFDYLASLNVESGAGDVVFDECGASPREIERLRLVRTTLLERRHGSSAEWIKDFEEQFLPILDQIAKARVGRYAKFVALKTAISPNGLLDFAIVVYNNFQLLADLCKIYQVRTSRIGTLYLLALILFNAYVAGEIGDALSNLGDEVAEAFVDTLGGVGAKMAGKVTSKATEAAANYLFTRRIGMNAVALLRPVATK